MRLILRAFAEYKTRSEWYGTYEDTAYTITPLRIAWDQVLTEDVSVSLVAGSAEDAGEIPAQDVDDMPREQFVAMLGAFYRRGWSVRFMTPEDSYEHIIKSGEFQSEDMKASSRLLHAHEHGRMWKIPAAEFKALHPFRLILDVQYVDLTEAEVWAAMLGMEIL